jgi:hypothetical protein
MQAPTARYACLSWPWPWPTCSAATPTTAWRSMSAWRSAAPGSTFTLRDHPVHDGSDDARDRFAILAVHHKARNNLRADV